MLELIIPKSIATPGLLAYILTTKFAVLKSSVTNIDQTTVQVLKEPKKSKSYYMWVSGFMPQEVQGKLYKIEKEARLEELSPDQVYAQRQSTA